MKLAEFVYVVNSFNPIDLGKNMTNSMGKVAISSLKFTFLVNAIKYFFRSDFHETCRVYLINRLKCIDFEKNSNKE